MRNVGLELFANQLRAMANDLDEWNKRTERSAVPPQEPVVQSACNEHGTTEQAAGVVQDGKEQSDRKALSVQSAEELEDILCKRIMEALENATSEHAAQLKRHKIGNARHWSGIKRGFAEAILIVQDVFADLQVEHEAKRAAAD